MMTFDSANDAQVFALQAFAQNDANVRSFLDALAAAVPGDQQDAIVALYMTPAQTQVQDALNALAAQALGIDAVATVTNAVNAINAKDAAQPAQPATTQETTTP
jgi:hypothetical protein